MVGRHFFFFFSSLFVGMVGELLETFLPLTAFDSWVFLRLNRRGGVKSSSSSLLEMSSGEVECVFLLRTEGSVLEEPADSIPSFQIGISSDSPKRAPGGGALVRSRGSQPLAGGAARRSG